MYGRNQTPGGNVGEDREKKSQVDVAEIVEADSQNKKRLRKSKSCPQIILLNFSNIIKAEDREVSDSHNK